MRSFADKKYIFQTRGNFVVTLFFSIHRQLKLIEGNDSEDEIRPCPLNLRHWPLNCTRILRQWSLAYLPQWQPPCFAMYARLSFSRQFAIESIAFHVTTTWVEAKESERGQAWILDFTRIARNGSRLASTGMYEYILVIVIGNTRRSYRSPRTISPSCRYRRDKRKT